MVFPHWPASPAGNRQPVQEALAPPAPPPAVHAVPAPEPAPPSTQPPNQAPSALAEAPASGLPEANQPDPVPAVEPVAPARSWWRPRNRCWSRLSRRPTPLSAKPSTYNPKTSPPRTPSGTVTATNDPGSR